jgi:hypothetical protein
MSPSRPSPGETVREEVERVALKEWPVLGVSTLEKTTKVSIQVEVAAVATTFWLALAKVRCGIPSWLIAAVMALARARALVRSMVVACSVPNVDLR